MTVKTCTKCGETKPVSEYAKLSTGKHGVRGNCKACVNRTAQANRQGWRGPTGRVASSGLEVLRDV